MTAHLSAAEAAALGLTPRKPARQTRRTIPGPYWSQCVACDTVFTTRAAEDRHVTAGHNRYNTLEGTTTTP